MDPIHRHPFRYAPHARPRLLRRLLSSPTLRSVLLTAGPAAGFSVLLAGAVFRYLPEYSLLAFLLVPLAGGLLANILYVDYSRVDASRPGLLLACGAVGLAVLGTFVLLLPDSWASALLAAPVVALLTMAGVFVGTQPARPGGHWTAGRRPAARKPLPSHE